MKATKSPFPMPASKNLLSLNVNMIDFAITSIS
ncbi:Uncharacterised protein [Segatella copri]|nr:Uncharacterised protein [Segatella copri]